MTDDDAHLAMSGEELDDLFTKRIEPTLHAPKQAHPVVTVVNGPAGAGKTTVTSAVMRDLDRTDAAVIEGDDLLAFHPQYHAAVRENDLTGAGRISESLGVAWTKAAYRSVREQRSHAFLVGLFPNVGSLLTLLRPWRDVGYRTEVVLVGTDEARAILGTVDRYARNHHPELDRYSRWPDLHHQIHDRPKHVRLAEDIDRAGGVDAVHIARRGEGIVWSKERNPDGSWSSDPSVREAFEAERGRLWTPAEAADVRDRLAALHAEAQRLPQPVREALDHAAGLARPPLARAERARQADSTAAVALHGLNAVRGIHPDARTPQRDPGSATRRSGTAERELAGNAKPPRPEDVRAPGRASTDPMPPRTPPRQTTSAPQPERGISPD